MTYLLIALGGGIGAAARYLIGDWIYKLSSEPDFPLGTFVVNISGAFLVGIAFGLSGGWPISSGGWSLLAVGVLGGYTTFSTFANDTLKLLAESRYGLVVLNLLTGPVGLIAVVLGLALVRSLR